VGLGNGRWRTGRLGFYWAKVRVFVIASYAHNRQQVLDTAREGTILMLLLGLSSPVELPAHYKR
jgi:hypothetical protein